MLRALAACILQVKCFEENADDPFGAFDRQQRPNAHALQKLALEAKTKRLR